MTNKNMKKEKLFKYSFKIVKKSNIMFKYLIKIVYKFLNFACFFRPQFQVKFFANLCPETSVFCIGLSDNHQKEIRIFTLYDTFFHLIFRKDLIVSKTDKKKLLSKK